MGSQSIKIFRWTSQSRTRGNGKEIKAELKDMQVNEKFTFNLFSVTRMLQKGYTLKGDTKSITLEKGNHAFMFDSVIWTRVLDSPATLPVSTCVLIGRVDGPFSKSNILWTRVSQMNVTPPHIGGLYVRHMSMCEACVL